MNSTEAISIHLPAETVADLLDTRGWNLDEKGRRVNPESGVTYWHPSEALTVALIDEVQS